MKLTVFQSDKGDSILLTTNDGKNMLIDGGMGHSYTDHVAQFLSKLRTQGNTLDVVYVSHIDSDHISGVLRMFDDLLDWRVHDYQRTHNNPDHKPPKSHRPPDTAAVWHNAFHELVDDNEGKIEDMLAATALVLSGHSKKKMQEAAQGFLELANSQREAILLSRRVGPEQLKIKLNSPAKGKLMLVRKSKKSIQLGSLKLFLIGPFPEDLTKLRKEWNKWLEENEEALEKIRKKSKVDEDRLTGSEIERIMLPLLTQAEELGNRKSVTTPNLASLMFLAEEGNKKVLLTGDGHSEDILKGLQHYGKIQNGGLHVDVLKVQHHGSEHNINAEFCKSITADHYIFCANGAHENPDTRVVEAIVKSRAGGAAELSANPEAGNRFDLWFNSHSSIAVNQTNEKHMKKVEKLVKALSTKHPGRFRSHFLKTHNFSITV